MLNGHNSALNGAAQLDVLGYCSIVGLVNHQIDGANSGSRASVHGDAQWQLEQRLRQNDIPAMRFANIAVTRVDVLKMTTQATVGRVTQQRV